MNNYKEGVLGKLENALQKVHVGLEAFRFRSQGFDIIKYLCKTKVSYNDFLKDIPHSSKRIRPTVWVKNLLDYITHENVKYCLKNRIFESNFIVFENTENTFKNIFRNLCYLYRFLISEGFKNVDSEMIHKYRNVMKEIGVPFYILQELEWPVIWCKFEGFKDRYFGTLLNELLVDEFHIEHDLKLYEEKVNYYLFYHLLLHHFYKGYNREISDSKMEERVVLSYIELIELYPELEQAFGVSIEVDMEEIKDLYL